MRAHAALVWFVFISNVARIAAAEPAALEQAPNTWVKRSPLAQTPPSPRLGYEGACVWDHARRVLIRYGGHNQGGGGEQHAEVWTFDPITAVWTLKGPNTSPPGVCCAQQNVFDPIGARYVRFPAFSGNHGWQWWRELYLNDSSVWSYDSATNTWRDMRPLPAPKPSPLRCASWDSDREVVVLFGGEGNNEGTLVYDPHENAWTRMKPSRQPASRSGGNMAYDAARKLHILFGAQSSNDPHTWAYDLGKNEWRDLAPATMPPADKNDCVLTYDSINRVIIALIKISEGEEEAATHRLETWSFDAGANEWKKMNPAREPDATGNRARNLMFAPELNVALLENRTHGKVSNEQQIWTYRFGGTPPAPGARESRPRQRETPRVVEDLAVSIASTTRAELSWKSAGETTGYVVERARVEVLSEDQLPRLKGRTPPLDEPSVGALRRIGPFQRLTPTPLRAPRFTDSTIDLAQPAPIEGEAIYERTFSGEQLDASGKPYRFAVHAYRVRAVNAQGVESGPSPACFTIPTAPQFVFCKEEGGSAQLAWAAPASGARAYPVYRMDGRFDKEPLPRLTAEPISALTFTDPAAGKSTRRYHIVAVDVLGQEGFPSSPVWFKREWQKYYEPFAGEWHQ